MAELFQELREKHISLMRASQSDIPTGDLVEEAKTLLQELRNGGKDITESNQRQRLASYTAYWGSYIFNATGEYPDTELESISDEASIHLVPISGTNVSSPLGTAPPIPTLIIGREETLRELKVRLIMRNEDVAAVTIIRGWPGVGKSTIVAALAHDPDIIRAFPDGILWTSLGEHPDLHSTLAGWGQTLGLPSLTNIYTIENAAAELTAALRNRRMLLILDDVWDAKHAIALRVGGYRCAMLITTRSSAVARALAPTPDDVYHLDILSDEEGYYLLGLLAPTVVEQYPQETHKLVQGLEGLPLALTVAGHLLNTEACLGWGISDLLNELYQGKWILEAEAPLDRNDPGDQTVPTVGVLLEKSTGRLDPQIRERFAILSAFAPKPATFDLNALAHAWNLSDPKPTARLLVDRGLLEPTPERRFQMHALLVLHARSILEHEQDS